MLSSWSCWHPCSGVDGHTEDLESRDLPVLLLAKGVGDTVPAAASVQKKTSSPASLASYETSAVEAPVASDTVPAGASVQKKTSPPSSLASCETWAVEAPVASNTSVGSEIASGETETTEHSTRGFPQAQQQELALQKACGLSCGSWVAPGPEVVVDEEKVCALVGLLEAGQPLGYFSEFAKEYGDSAFCRRLLRKCNGDVKKATLQLKGSLAWRQDYAAVLTTRKFAHASDYRPLGVDLEGRPVCYYCAKNQLVPLGQVFDQQVVCLLQAIDNMPPDVESAVHIWDLHGFMLHLNLNPAPLARIFKMLDGYFAERLHALVLVDMPSVGLFLKNAVWPLLPESTKRKILFLPYAAMKDTLKTRCTANVAGRIVSSMDQNRDVTVSLEERKRSWQRANEYGALVQAFPL